MHALYVYVKKGAAFKPGDLVGMGHALRADYLSLPNGDAFGKVVATTADARAILNNDPNITVLPPIHRPLKQKHADAFNQCGITVDITADTAYEVGEKLHIQHKVAWLHPETWFTEMVVGNVDAIIIEPDAPSASGS